MSQAVYPWQNKQWDYFKQLIETKSLPHAIMISGAEGVGKHHFAHVLSSALLCLEPTQAGFACGECKHCKLVAANTYPDLIRISEPEDSSAIAIDDIRELIAKLSLTRHFDAYKVAVIERAELMNTNAANALLKTLEEPPENTILILVTSSPMSLPATIRSRAHSLTLPTPTESEALNWLNEIAGQSEWEQLLKVSQGAPLKALEYHETDLLDQRITVMQGFLSLFEHDARPLQVAAKIEPIQFALIVQWIQGIILDLLRIKGADNPITLENPDFYRPLLALSPRLPVPLLLEFWQLFLENKQLFDNSLNRKLFVESILIKVYKLQQKHSVQ